MQGAADIIGFALCRALTTPLDAPSLHWTHCSLGSSQSVSHADCSTQPSCSMRAILSTNCPAVGPRRADKPQNKAITAVRHVCHLLYASATGRAPAALSAATTARPPATSHVLCSCNHLAWRTLQTTHTHTHTQLLG